MSKKRQLVVPFGNGWAVQIEGRKTASVITTRQSEAILYAKEAAKKQRSEVIIHGKDGKIKERSNYGKKSYSTGE